LEGPSHNDHLLLSLLKQGDQEAFAQLYRLYSEQLYKNLLKLIKSEELAGEILQEIFIQLWEKRQTIDIQFSFRSYLFRMGENKVYDFYRKLKRDQKLFAYIKATATEHYTHIEEALLSRENVLLLQEAINVLPPQRRLIFDYCKIQGKSYAEVSEILGISTSTINDHIVKATRAIRQFIYTHQDVTIVLFLFSICHNM
jgi:RNA polymerase sigma-70 factor (family 1)